MKHRIIAIIFGIALFLTILMASVSIAVYDKTFFLEEAQKNDVVLNTGLSMPEISQVTDEIFAYLKGDRRDFDITVTRQGDVKHLFNENEQKHMIDVEYLMIFQRTVLVFSLIFTLLAGVYLFREKRDLFNKTLIRSGAIGLILVGLSGLIASTGFTAVFVRLHEVIFSNDLWLMDPAKEVLINIVPEPYFIHLALYIGSLTVFACALSILFGLFFRKRDLK